MKLDTGKTARRLRRRIAAWVQSLEGPTRRTIFLALDIVLAVAAYLATFSIMGGGLDAVLGTDTGWLMLGMLALVSGVLSTILGVPDIRMNHYDGRGMMAVALLSALVAGMGATLHTILELPAAQGAFVVYGVLLVLLSAVTRVAIHDLLVALYRRQGPRVRVLIYGAGTTGMQLARALAAHPSIEPIAFVDDNPALQSGTIGGLPVLRPVDIKSVAAERRVRRVLMAMPSLSRPKQARLGRRLQALGLDVQMLPSFAQLVGEEPLVEKLVPLNPARLMGRRSHSHPGADAPHLRGRSVLVSGGGGSIGSELCRQVLAARPRRLVIFELSEYALYEVERGLRPLAEDMGVELVAALGSVTEQRLVRRLLADNHVEVVLHAAAYKHVSVVERNPLVGLANNVLGTWVLAREAKSAGVDRFVLISSDKAVRPTNVMGASKRLAELVVQDLADRSETTVFAMVRFGNVFGSSGSVIPKFKEQIESGGPVTVTHRDVTRYFMTVEEAVSLVLSAGGFATGGEVFVLNMGEPVRIWDLATRLIHEAGYTVRSAETPDGDVEIIETGLQDGEKLHEELLIGEGQQTTGHDKIFRAREARLSEIEVAHAIRTLRSALAAGDEQAALRLAARYVEGFEAKDTAHVT